MISLPEHVVKATTLVLTIVSQGERQPSEPALARAVRHHAVASGVLVRVCGVVLQVAQSSPEGKIVRVAVDTKVCL